MHFKCTLYVHSAAESEPAMYIFLSKCTGEYTYSVQCNIYITEKLKYSVIYGHSL